MSKYCPKCNQVLRDEDTFCMHCGAQYHDPNQVAATNPAPVQSVILRDNQSGQTKPVSQEMPVAPAPAVSVASAGASKTAVEKVSKSSSEAMFGFVSADEKPRYSLKNGYLANMIGAFDMKTNDAVITNKRVYFNAMSWRNLTKSRTEMIVDLEDITGTMVSRVRSYGLLLLGILLALVGTIFAFFFSDKSTYFVGATVASYLVSICVLFIWLATNVLTKRTLFKIEYSGGGSGSFGQSGSINFDVNMYSLKSVKEFQNEIFRAKDELKKSGK